jgi:hypothetical protein
MRGLCVCRATAELCRVHNPIIAIGLASGVAAGKVEGDSPREGSLPSTLYEGAVAALRSLMADAACESAVRDAMTRLVPEAQQELATALA